MCSMVLFHVQLRFLSQPASHMLAGPQQQCSAAEVASLSEAKARMTSAQRLRTEGIMRFEAGFGKISGAPNAGGRWLPLHLGRSTPLWPRQLPRLEYHNRALG